MTLHPVKHGGGGGGQGPGISFPPQFGSFLIMLQS